jgi:hypothetical protein
VVHLRFFPHTIFANCNLHGVGILGEPEAVCMAAQEESAAELNNPLGLPEGRGDHVAKIRRQQFFNTPFILMSKRDKKNSELARLIDIYRKYSDEKLFALKNTPFSHVKSEIKQACNIVLKERGFDIT